ncbi:16S rRNA (cytosine(967)-C(5))-methyltransferase RsmB [Paracidobacterium acidisoli]|uniref:16S rRNA (cytosine(967)-C(5))-methyltransferase n=1 Tax=Paracidobacterium acidisoli TaxID=2303751 RepID=A0A372IKI6_9BACT|nr:16S rRNA (cytosine(967)-C(5))-methyltransferase RsmB [Paracidobacterium acidisoli]MBT9332856.1 16S rRNA (cytosine(967)-C(5))-methyltransferase RsmB [Paracidobacterium acidisoli]
MTGMGKTGRISPARAVSYQILIQIEERGAHSDELLRSPEVDALSAQDRNLTTTLVLGTLRWQSALDMRIQPLLQRPETELSAQAAAALRLGAYQLLYLDRIPPHAAISESVELVKQSPERFAAGMVNAVLRKISQQPRAQTAAHTASARQTADDFAHPQWMVERWARFYGMEAAQAVCAFDQQPAPVAIRLLDERAEAELSAAGIELTPGEFLHAARRVVKGDVSRTEVFRAGRVRIQDEGSQLVAELAAAAQPGAQRILDACAAPGGKTAILAERNGMAEITALDISKRRLDAMRHFLRPVDPAGRIRFELADAVKIAARAKYDLILCDVPCSGTGTIARNPEIRFRVDPSELARQQAKQTAILTAALQALAPGGRLLYSTCSLEPEENERVAERATGAGSAYRAVPVETPLGTLSADGTLTAEGAKRASSAMANGCLRTIPGVHPCDGFFAAVFERKE